MTRVLASWDLGGARRRLLDRRNSREKVGCDYGRLIYFLQKLLSCFALTISIRVVSSPINDVFTAYIRIVMREMYSADERNILLETSSLVVI